MALAPTDNTRKTVLRKPERYTTDEVILALQRSKGLVTVAAAALGCHPSTVEGYIRRHPTVAQAKRDARENILDMTEARLFEAINNREPWAIALTLRTIGKERGYVERNELTGANGGPVTVRVVYGGTDDPAS